MRKRAAVAAVTFLGMTLGGASARASDASDTERARKLFEEAGQLERQGHWTAAQRRLRAALRLRDTPHLHYALGWALENGDSLKDARVEYQTAVRLSRGHPGGGEVARLASERVAELDKTLPILKVRASSSSNQRVRVVVDGHEEAREGGMATVPVNPGSHVVRVERDSRAVFEEIVYVGRGEIRTVDTGAGTSSTALQEDRTRPPSSDGGTERSGDVLPWVLLSGGFVLMAGGGALLFSASKDADRGDAHRAQWCLLTACTASSTARPETAEAAGYRRSAEEAAQSEAAKNVAGFVFGGAGLVAGAAGAFLLLRGDAKPPSAEVRRAAVRTSAAPLPGGGMATATFSF